MIFQEYDCPVTGIDFDLNEAEIVCAGQSFRCACCEQSHVAGVDVAMQTAIGREGSGDRLDFRPLPRDATERAAWLAESAAMDAAPTNATQAAANNPR